MSDGVNHLVRNRHLVEDLGGALRSGQHGLDVVPGLVQRLIEDESWREFTTQRGEHVQHEQFADFVTTPPLAGIGSNPDLIERIIEPFPETLRLFRNAMKGKRGPQSFRNNITKTRKTITGTSRAYALDRLKRDAPELHADVLAGNLSAHAAMVKAGYRPPTFTVRADSPRSVATALRRRLDADDLAEIARLLTED